MLPDRVSNPGPLTYESGALPRGWDVRPYFWRRYIQVKCKIGAVIECPTEKSLSPQQQNCTLFAE